MHNYDVIIIGAGSIGVPTSIALTKLGLKTLVIDSNPSPGQGDNKKAIRTGDTLPPFSATDLDGKAFSLASHKGSPVIVRFFLLNCPYCKADTPIFNKFYEKYRKKGLEIVYINNNGTNPEEVQKFADDLKIQFPVIFDQEGKIAKQYNIRAQPLALVLSPEHKLLAALL